MIAANKLEKKTGVYVYEVVPDQPVDNQQIHTGDIIVGFNDKPIGSVDELHKELGEEVIHRKITVDLLRGGHKLKAIVTPGEMH
jgi:S1-C subfamily serine protease